VTATTPLWSVWAVTIPCGAATGKDTLKGMSGNVFSGWRCWRRPHYRRRQVTRTPLREATAMTPSIGGAGTDVLYGRKRGRFSRHD
jgi:hypothetical protein